jgi:hypothetical protein
MLDKKTSSNHSYDILGAGMLWKPKEARKFVKICAEECFDKVLYHVNSQILKCKMKNVITMLATTKRFFTITFVVETPSIIANFFLGMFVGDTPSGP